MSAYARVYHALADLIVLLFIIVKTHLLDRPILILSESNCGQFFENKFGSHNDEI